MGDVSCMKRLALTLLSISLISLISLIASIAVIRPALAAEPGARTILVMGDSISAAYGIQREYGWVRLLEQRLAEHTIEFHVVNASISGETTSGGLSRLPKALELHAPEIVIIELGGNDALRGYPIDAIQRNLRRMIELSHEVDARVVLMGMEIPPNYGDRYTQAFRGIYRDLAQSEAVGLVPFLLEGVALEEELMQSDGIHPTAAGQPRLLDNIWPVLGVVLGADDREAPTFE